MLLEIESRANPDYFAKTIKQLVRLLISLIKIFHTVHADPCNSSRFNVVAPRFVRHTLNPAQNKLKTSE